MTEPPVATLDPANPDPPSLQEPPLGRDAAIGDPQAAGLAECPLGEGVLDRDPPYLAEAADLSGPQGRRGVRRLARRLLIALVEAVAAVAAVLVMGLGILVVRLALGPLQVGFLTPALVHYLGAEADPLGIAIDGTALSWGAGRSTIDLVASQVRLKDPSGQDLVRLPKVSISISLRALIQGRLAPTRLALIGPSVKLVRGANGVVGLDLDAGTPAETPSSPPAADPLPPLPTILRALAGRGRPDDPIGLLNQVTIVGGSIRMDDRALKVEWRAEELELRLERQEQGLGLTGSVTADLGPAHSRLTLSATYALPSGQITYRLASGEVDPSRAVPAAPADWSALGAVHLPVGLALEGSLDPAHLMPGPTHLAVTLGAGSLLDPRLVGGRLDLVGGGAEMSWDPAAGSLRLAQARIDLGGALIDLSGGVDGIGGARPWTASASLAVHDLAIDRFRILWPESLAPGARRWILDNLSVGTVSDLHADAQATWDPTSAAAHLQSLGGTMAVRNASVDFLHGLPKLEAVDATIAFSDKRMDFAINTGRLAGITLKSGTLGIDFASQPVERMVIDAAIAGPATAVMTVLDQKPLGYPRMVGIDPATVGGSLDGTLHFAFPLKETLRFSDVDFGAKASLTDLALPHIAAGRDLSEGRFSLTLDRTRIGVTGAGKIADTPARITWSQRIGGTADPVSEVRVTTVLDEAARQRLDLVLPADRVRGKIGVDLHLVEAPAGQSQMTVAVDLTPAGLAIVEAGWSKEPGEAARADLSATLIGDRLDRLDRLTVTAPALNLAGFIHFADGQMDRMEFDRLDIGASRAAGTIDHGKDGVWAIRLHGPVMDIGPLLESLGDKTPPSPGEGPSLDIKAETDRLIMGAGRAFTAASFKGVVARHRLDQAVMAAHLAGGHQFHLTLNPVDAGGAFKIDTDDFGELLRVFDVSGNVVGGVLSLGGTTRLDGSARRFAGRLEVTGYRLVRTPFLARLLALASFTSLASLLSGQGLPFDRLVADLWLRDGVLNLERAEASGGALGVTARGWIDLGGDRLDLEGTLVPAYTLNSILGNVPVLGDLLNGGSGQGLFGVNFHATGPLGEPNLRVNPLSVLAPGFLRRLFLFDAPGASPTAPAVRPDPTPTAPSPGAAGAIPDPTSDPAIDPARTLGPVSPPPR